jgi:hypothetical protein
VICMSCKKDRPIESFAKPRGTNRRARRCTSCKKTATCAVKRWHKRGRECSRCGEVRPCPDQITDYAWRPAICAVCQRAAQRARQAEWARVKRANDDDFRRRQIEATRRWLDAHPDYKIEAERRRYRAIKADPARYERLKEDARMRYRLRQMAKGRDVRVLSAKTYAKRYGTGYGNAPTVEVNDELRRLAKQDLALHGDRGTDKRVREIASGLKWRVSLMTADRLCVKYGIPLTLLFPDLAA